jgi:hypothetical protein
VESTGVTSGATVVLEGTGVESTIVTTGIDGVPGVVRLVAGWVGPSESALALPALRKKNPNRTKMPPAKNPATTRAVRPSESRPSGSQP